MPSKKHRAVIYVKCIILPWGRLGDTHKFCLVFHRSVADAIEQLTEDAQRFGWGEAIIEGILDTGGPRFSAPNEEYRP